MRNKKYFGLFVLLFVFMLCLFGCGKKTYNITFVLNNGEENMTAEVKSADEINLPNVSKEGYDFDAWYKDSGFKEKFAKEDKLESDLTLYANWKIKEFEVKFYVDGSVVDTQKVEYNGSATAPADPELYQYDFGGWDKTFTNVTSDLEVNAILNLKKFSVKFMKDSQELKTEEVEYGKAATAPADPSKAGFNFTGWDNEFNYITSDLIVKAQFEAKTINIKYYDGTTELDLQPKSFTYGSSITLPTYSESGYYFVGWYTDSGYELIYNPDEDITQDLNLYALLIKIDYNGGSNSWTVGAWNETNTVTKGLSAISSLASEYEKDFYKYLSESELLNDEKLGEGLSVSSFEEFSSVNKLHNGDPQRVWNDTVTNKADDTACGYSALFLYDKLELDENGVLKDIIGGFLGTEPYKTKYFNLVQQITVLYKSKYPNSNMAGGGPSACQLCAFIIDGYFYGTQGVSSSSKADFAAFRTAIPTTTKYYTWDGSKAVEHDKEYVFTTDATSLDVYLAVPFYEGKTFAGWYTDSACTQKLEEATIVSKMTVYAKWE